MLDVNQNDLPSAIDNHHSITEVAIHLLSRSNPVCNPVSLLLPNRTTEECFKKSFTDMEGRAEETACLEIPNLAILSIKSLQIQSMNLNFSGSGHLELVANRTDLRDKIVSNESPTPKKFTLEAYDFSPDCMALQQHIDFSKLQSLELMNCANLGFLFNHMLCTYKTYHLKKLRIRKDTLECQHAGYFGKEKFERFLMLYTGLQELIFTNLGANRPGLQAISAQGATLQALTMHESRNPNRSDSIQRSTFTADDLRHLLKRCQRMQHLSVELSAINMSYSSGIAEFLRRFQSLTHLGILLPPGDQSLSLDRAWAIRTFKNIASPWLKRLDVYSGESHSDPTVLQGTSSQTLACHWRIHRKGTDVLAVEIIPLADKGKRTTLPA